MGRRVLLVFVNAMYVQKLDYSQQSANGQRLSKGNAADNEPDRIQNAC